MERSILQSQYREDSGKGVARKLRQSGRVPAIVYGRKEEPISLSVKETDLKRILIDHGDSAIIDLSVEGKNAKAYNAIIRDVQTHSATGRILHVDFQRISLDEKVRTSVSIELRGDPKGVKESGGILEHGLRELSIVCVPSAIPASIEIEVGGLEIGDGIHVSDIIGRYPDIEFLDEPESSLAIVVHPKLEVEPGAKEGEDEEGAVEPELISKDKKEEAGESGEKAGKE
jgi:large subunit ribosomal protein L25